MYAEAPIDKLIGTWQLNVAKSKITSDTANQIMKIDKADANTLKISIERVTKSGEKRPVNFTRICDGKEHHGAGLRPGITETCDPATLSVVASRDGKPISQMHLTFAADRRSHTVSRKTLNDQGKWVEEEFVYERQ